MSTDLDDIPDLYEHEKKIADMCRGAMQRRYANERNMADETVQARFDRETAGLFAENGLIASVAWVWRDTDPETGEITDMSPTVADDPADRNIYWQPRIKVTGRVDKLKEYDHDRQKHEVRAGVFDGVKGVIDPNTGTMKDDPKRKVIS